MEAAKATGRSCWAIRHLTRKLSVGNSLFVKFGHKKPKIWPHSVKPTGAHLKHWHQAALASADTDLLAGIYYHELKVLDGVDAATMMAGAIIIKRALKIV